MTMLQGFREAYKKNADTLKKYENEMVKITSIMPENDKLSHFYLDFFMDTVLLIFPNDER